MPAELSIERIRAIVMDEASKGAYRAGVVTAGEIQRRTPVKTGQARRSITAGRPRVNGQTLTVTIGSNVAHVRYLDGGTGLYGPKHQKITPKARQALAFVATASKGKGQPYTLAGRLRNGPGRAGDAGAALSGLVVVRSVKGIKPLHMFAEGISASRDARLRELRAVGPAIERRLAEAAR